MIGLGEELFVHSNLYHGCKNPEVIKLYPEAPKRQKPYEHQRSDHSRILVLENISLPLFMFLIRCRSAIMSFASTVLAVTGRNEPKWYLRHHSHMNQLWYRSCAHRDHFIIIMITTVQH